MDIASMRQRLEYLVHTHSSVFAAQILESGLTCARCGWCCRENFNIRISKNILRPSNAISVFPDDIRRIIKGKGLQWDEIAQPDIYSCLDDGKNIRLIGWILQRGDNSNCIFHRNGGCSIYEWRPMICRCYPFFIGDQGVEVMHCEGKNNDIMEEKAKEMAFLVKRYEMKKLRNYIGIIYLLGEKLRLSDLSPMSRGYEGEVIVCDGDTISRHIIKKEQMG
ncbi:MAG: YkgJ family cysteine cluster protein [Methanosarcinales archaeon]|nr:MAG: YkgJ family cysteine cluster protein [Methanosarcinales archaeon]